MKNQRLRREFPTGNDHADSAICQRNTQLGAVELARRKARNIARQASYRTNPEHVLARQDELAEEFALELGAVMGGAP